MASVASTGKNNASTTETTRKQIISPSKSSDDLYQRVSSENSEDGAATMSDEDQTCTDKPNFKSKTELIKFSILIAGIVFAMFMMSLNSTVVAPAMSIIATELNSLESQTWIATAYLVGLNAFQPLSGKVRCRSNSLSDFN